MASLSVDVAWGELAAASSFVLAVFAIIGGVVRYVLMPYLRAELIEPTRETNRQLTGSETPAPADPTLREQLDELRGEIGDATLELRAMAMMFDGHIEWAQEEADTIRRERQAIVDEIWAELKRQRDAGTRPAPPRHRGDTA